MTASTLTFASTIAGQRARANLNANLQALRQTQPWLEVERFTRYQDVEWVLARDGQLTGRFPEQNRWYADCSVPRRAGEELLRDMVLEAGVGCLLRPMHAAHVDILLAKLRPQQALIVVQDEATDAGMLLACADLSEQIRRHRLWFALGDHWGDHLQLILTRSPGLPVPGQYVRTQHRPLEQSAPLMTQANALLGKLTQKRLTMAEQLGHRPPADCPGGRVVVAIPSQFRLWDMPGEAFRTAFANSPHIAIDTDDPTESSALALGIAAARADAMLLPNLGRCDLNSCVIPPHQPIITWVAGARIPAPLPEARRDGLILCDSSLKSRAMELGWPESRLRIGGWPMPVLPEATGNVVGLIANTRPAQLSKAYKELSSLAMMEYAICEQLNGNPRDMGDDPLAYLRRTARRINVPEASLDFGALLEQVLYPAYQQNLARHLVSCGVNLRIWGSGWDCCEDMVSRWAGEIADSRDFHQAILACRLVAEDWPSTTITALHRCGRPTLKAAGRTRDEILRQIAKPATMRPDYPTITAELVMELLE